jgi:hypothetical protein
MRRSIRLIFIAFGLVQRLESSSADDDSCGVEVSVGCTMSDGQPCKTINLTCNESRRSRLAFRYSADRCAASSNEQGARTRCVDKKSPQPDRPVRIMCRSESNRRPVLVEPESVLPGDTFEVSGLFDSMLPSSIECMVRDEERASIQEMVFGTSTTDALHLMDRFGAFTLSSCDDQSCQRTLSYSISITNNASSAANIQSLAFSLNSNTYDLLSVLTSPQIAAGEVVDISGSRTIEVCAEEHFFDAVAFVRYDLLDDQICQTTGK